MYREQEEGTGQAVKRFCKKKKSSRCQNVLSNPEKRAWLLLDLPQTFLNNCNHQDVALYMASCFRTPFPSDWSQFSFLNAFCLSSDVPFVKIGRKSRVVAGATLNCRRGFSGIFTVCRSYSGWSGRFIARTGSRGGI